ncbi:MAG: AI-2E family transporter [Jatrophihabitans sp.]|uniref:AI-2E family transporter n=1 Tax=Jatrophihabitans sp. TaxID=1932789 RepID=UPI003F7E299D
MTEKRSALDSVTMPVQVAAAWTWRLLVILAGLYVLGQMFLTVELVAFSFILALFFTAVLHPIERRLDRALPGPRSLSAALALLFGVAALGGIGTFVVWQISTHSTELANQLTALVTHFRNWLHNGPLHLKSSDIDKLSTQFTDAVKNHQGALINGAIQTAQTVAEYVGAFLLILLSTFFLLRDGELIWRWTLRLLPTGAQARMDLAGRVGWRTLGGYMRGQVLIALFHGISVMIVLFVLRVPLAAALGVLIFLGSFIPLVGLTVTGALCVAVALLEHGFTAAIVVTVAIVVLIQLEAHLLQPFIMSRSVEVHPLAIALSVITGTTIAGIPGALLAVPLVAFLNATIAALRRPLEVAATEQVLRKMPANAEAVSALAQDFDPTEHAAPPPKSRAAGVSEG